MKEIYIVLSYTGSLPSAIIKKATGAEYSHVSIAVSDKLDEMYSFGRIYTYFPWYGGFIRENITKGLFKRNKNAKIAVYSIKVESQEYNKTINIIEQFSSNRKDLFYDYGGAIGMKFGRNLFRKNGYVCSSFTYEIMSELGIPLSKPIHEMFPIDFAEIDGLTKVYEGPVSAYLNDIQS